MKHVKVAFSSKNPAQYSYKYDGDILVGDVVMVSVRNHMKHALVTDVDYDFPSFELKEIISVCDKEEADEWLGRY